jgi:hypothetical protein
METLQMIFYILGITYMVVGLIILIVIGVAILTIKKTITDLHKTVEAQIERFTNDPADMALEIGQKMASKAVKRIKESLEG